MLLLVVAQIASTAVIVAAAKLPVLRRGSWETGLATAEGIGRFSFHNCRLDSSTPDWKVLAGAIHERMRYCGKNDTSKVKNAIMT